MVWFGVGDGTYRMRCDVKEKRGSRLYEGDERENREDGKSRPASFFAFWTDLDPVHY